MSSAIRGVLFIFVLLGCRPMPAVAQTKGDVRLDSDGRVKFYNSDLEWASICSTDWDEKDAAVVCRQLDEDTLIRFYVEANTVPGITEPYLHDLVDCEGNEEKLKDCPFRKFPGVPCVPSASAAVTCGRGFTVPVIAGIAVGCLVVLLIVAGVIVSCIRWSLCCFVVKV